MTSKTELQPGQIRSNGTRDTWVTLGDVSIRFQSIHHEDLPGTVILSAAGLAALIDKCGEFYRAEGRALSAQEPVKIEIVKLPPMDAEIVRDSAGRVARIVED